MQQVFREFFSCADERFSGALRWNLLDTQRRQVPPGGRELWIEAESGLEVPPRCLAPSHFQVGQPAIVEGLSTLPKFVFHLRDKSVE
jgi:hypothetical protein